jgi:serine/threonine protein kinase
MLRRCCSHPNIVRLQDVVVGKNKGVFLVFEYCEHDLSSLLRNHENGLPFTESEVKCLMQQLLDGLAFLHESFIIHRDIKLSNLLYDNRGCLKIADFGLARLFSYPSAEHVLTPTVVTLWYRAAELLMGSTDYSVAIDVWAAGCAMGELLLGHPLIDGDNERDQLEKIFKLLGSPNARIWPEVVKLPVVVSGQINLRREQERYPYNNLNVVFPRMNASGYDLLQRMLALDPKKRITARSALRHDYFYCSPFPKEQDLMPTFPSSHKL